ncbi:hypothetical protein R1sor_002355 [Riccia sorocarpa]|uniref:Protein YIP n=1 Tax=Riccia sorocarpa TaxID=122646 RepID=A0ABD3GYL7_9MARC
MSRSSEKTPLHTTSQSDIDEIESLFNISVQPATIEVPTSTAPGKPATTVPQAASIPVSSDPRPSGSGNASSSTTAPAAGGPAAFGGVREYNTLTEPVWATLKRDVVRVATNLRHVVFPNPYREDPGKALRDWDLWGPFFFIIFLALTLSWSATENKSKVFAVVFAVLSAGAVVLTLNVQLLGGSIIFFQSLSLLGYCLFPLDIGAIVCLAKASKLFRSIVVLVTIMWSSWSSYPFVSTAVPHSRKALAVYPVLLLYISVGFLVLAND